MKKWLFVLLPIAGIVWFFVFRASDTIYETADPKDVVKIEEPDPETPFADGELLTYTATASKWLVSVKAGTCTFKTASANFGGRDYYVFDVHAKGGAFGYGMDTLYTSFVDRKTLYPIKSTFEQGGSETRIKRIQFARDMAVYFKRKTCRDTQGCPIVGHYAGGRHCTELDLDKPEFEKWLVRKVHFLTGDRQGRHAVDLISAIYRARLYDYRIGDEEKPSVIVLQDRSQQELEFAAVEEKTLNLPAGTFEALRLDFVPKATEASEDTGEKFEGPFGLKGKIDLWVHKKTKIPLVVEGTLPFGPLDVTISVRLKSVAGLKVETGRTE